MNKTKKLMIIVIISVILIASFTGVFLLNEAGKGTSYTNVSSVRLQIFGNANEDDTIDQRDLDFIKDVMDGKRSASNLTDANIDGTIDQADVDQVQSIIENRETILYYIDLDGYTTSVHMPVNTIVTLYTNNPEAVRVLNAESMIVGVDDDIHDYPDYFPALMSLPTVGDCHTPNVEEILKINPDIVFMGTREWYDPDLESKLNPNGIDVVRLPTWEYGRVSSGILILGYILDHEAEAYDYIQWHDNLVKKINNILDTIPQSERKTVFYERKGTTTVSYGSGQAESIEQAGGVNIAASMQGPYITYETEWVIEQNPDFIITQVSGGYRSTNQLSFEERMTFVAEKFSITDAIKEGKHHAIGSDILLGAGYIVGVVYLGNWFYPEQFQELNPQAIHQEFIDKFCPGLDFDVSTKVVVR